jgi:hypothetical protein
LLDENAQPRLDTHQNGRGIVERGGLALASGEMAPWNVAQATWNQNRKHYMEWANGKALILTFLNKKLRTALIALIEIKSIALPHP